MFRTSVKGRPTACPLQSSAFLKRRAAACVTGDSVKVYVRVKPVTEDELKDDRRQVAVSVHERDGQTGIAIPALNGKENWFADFDGVLDDATNQEVFDVVGGSLLTQFLQGMNVSVLAYGQTGSGKTYSMFGCDDPGARVQGLLQLILKRVDESVCIGTHHSRLSVAVYEVYNEELYALLDEAGPERRPLKTATYHHVKMMGVSSVEAAITAIMEALLLRTRDATVRNATSSRSHAFVKLRLEQLSAASDEQCTVSTMFIVDLAGSESIVNAYSNAQQKETIAINSSLNALERVVNSLSKQSPHVPYRDSLLTYVLHEGLDPSKARVALLTTISPFQADLAVTKSTLNFAMRAGSIRTYAQVNAARRAAPSGQEELQRQMQVLQAININLRQKLADLEGNHERLYRERHLEGMKAELARLADVHCDLQRNSEAAETALELERAEHAVTRSRLAEVQGSTGHLERALAGAEEEARVAVEAVSELRAQLAEARGEAMRLSGELVFARALTDEVQAQHRGAQEQLVHAKEQLTHLRGQLAVAESHESQYQQQLEAQLAQLRTEAQVSRNAALVEASALRQRVHDLQQDLAEAHSVAQRQAQELDEARAELALRVSEAEVELQALRERLQEAEQRAEQQAVEVQRLLGSVADVGASSVEALTSALSAAADLGQRASAMQGDARSRGDRRSSALLQPGGAGGPTLPPISQLQETVEQLETVTGQLAAMEEELAATREQLVEAEAAKGAALEQLKTIRELAEAEVQTLQEQLEEQSVALGRQASNHVAALAAAAQEARAAADADAGRRLVPLQTECERLRATVALSEQQLERLQAECERLRAEADSNEVEMRRLQAEVEVLREGAARAEAEAAERIVRLEAQIEQERDAGAPRAEALKQLQERLRQLEAERKRAEAEHRGCLELKDKLIRQLELMNHQLQSELAKLRQELVQAQVSDQHGVSALGGCGAASTSPFNGLAASDRTDAVSPCPAGEATPVSSVSGAAAGPSRSGILLLNRSTNSAAALARNTKAREMVTPPPRMAVAFTPQASPSNGLVSPPVEAQQQPLPPPEAIDLVTPASTPGPPEVRLTPGSIPQLDDGYVVVVRRQNQQMRDKLDISTFAVRNQMNI